MDSLSSAPRGVAARLLQGSSALAAAVAHTQARARTISSDDDKLHFADQELERRWREEGVTQNIRNGAMLLLVFQITAPMQKLVVAILDNTNQQQRAFFLDAAFAVVLAPALLQTLKRPRLGLHAACLGCYGVWVLLHGLYPFRANCAKICQRFVDQSHLPLEERSAKVVLETRNLDCTMQGHTAVEAVMTFIFISPHVIPQASLMWLNWVYIFGAYLGVSIIQRYYVSHLILYSKMDIVLTMTLLCLIGAIASTKKWYLEKSQRKKFEYDHKQREATARIFHILKYMVPLHVIVPMLKFPGQVIAEPVAKASILFVMITDFDQLARRLKPAELLAFLNKQFTKMDGICAQHHVTKIETVGEEYVCAVGVVPADQGDGGHSHILGRLVTVAQEVLQLQNDEVGFKMGLHTGPVVAGVIGQKLPRFRLFGDTVNTSARMMQKGVPGNLQFGEETKREMPKWVRTVRRGEIELKGKGRVTTYLLDTAKPAERHVAFSAAEIRMFDGEAPLGLSPERPAPPAPGTVRRSLTDEAVAAVSARGSALALLMAPDSAVPEEKHEDDSDEEDEITVATAPPDEDGQFEEVLRELSASDGRNMQSWRWWCSFGLKTTDFTPEVEEQWLRWFHENAICKKLSFRLDVQATFLLVLSSVEMFGVVAVGHGFVHKHWHGTDGLGFLRLPVFLICRLSSFALIMVWQRAARTRSRWLFQQPTEAQLLMLLSSCAVAALTFVSYDTMALTPPQVNINTNGVSLGELYRLLGLVNDTAAFDQEGVDSMEFFGFERRSAVFSLLYFAIFLIIMAQHPFLFSHSIIFMGLATILMAVSYFPFDRGMNFNLYWSFNGMTLFAVAGAVNASLQYSAERNSRLRFQAAKSVELTHKHIHGILMTLMPPLVVEEIRELPPNATPPTHTYHKAIIAQSDLVGFTKLASTQKPEEVVKFIGELFGLFDKLTDSHGVYKVETVGDAYIAGQAAFPLTQECWPVTVVLFGLEMVRQTQAWAKSHSWKVNCRVGVALGECIGGIVGTDMQRYHLFGQLMNVLEILESTAPEGRVQVSQACRLAVEEQLQRPCTPALRFEPREGNELKTSKGDVHDFAEAGGRTFVVVSDAGWAGLGGQEAPLR